MGSMAIWRKKVIEKRKPISMVLAGCYPACYWEPWGGHDDLAEWSVVKAVDEIMGIRIDKSICPVKGLSFTLIDMGN